MMREENKKMIFASRCREFRAVMKPTDVVLDDLRHPQILKGKTIVFQNGRYITNDPEEIKFLTEHPARPAEFDVVEDGIFKARKQDVQMLEGAMGAGVPIRVDETASRGKDFTNETTIEVVTAAVTEKVMQAVDEKFSIALGQILEAVKAPTYVKKKVFTCPVPGCGLTFPTGMATGAHKRIAHPELFEKKVE